jgi:hypothetical protein
MLRDSHASYPPSRRMSQCKNSASPGCAGTVRSTVGDDGCQPQAGPRAGKYRLSVIEMSALSGGTSVGNRLWLRAIGHVCPGLHEGWNRPGIACGRDEGQFVCLGSAMPFSWSLAQHSPLSQPSPAERWLGHPDSVPGRPCCERLPQSRDGEEQQASKPLHRQHAVGAKGARPRLRL